MNRYNNENKWPHLVTAIISVAGILWFDWSIVTILFVYWLETIVAGVFNVVRMMFDAKVVEKPTRRNPQGVPATLSRRLGVSVIFCLYFGASLLAHRFFIIKIADAFNQSLVPENWLWLILMPLCIEQAGAYFIEKQSGKGETVLITLLVLPYFRVIVQQAIVIASSIPLSLVSSAPQVAAIILVGVKVGAEATIAHLRSKS